MVSIAAIGPMGAPPPAFLAQAAPDGRVSVAAVSPGAVPNGRDLELWLLPPGAQRPTSLGVLPSGGKSLLLSAVPPDGSQLLVSLEPQGGSPTGQPTGAVLYGGKLAQPSGT
jgi:anti-sigma-K factor RskA